MKKTRAKTTPLKELIHDTAVNSAQSKVKVDLIIDHFISTIATALLKGSRPDVHNFGYFCLKDTRRPGVKTVAFVPRLRLIEYVSAPYKAQAEAGNDIKLAVLPPKKPKKGRRPRPEVAGKPVRVFREYPLTIPWEVAELAYAAYAERFGAVRRIENIVRGGGFTRAELDVYVPGWENRVQNDVTSAQSPA